jgi:hypothetical protein
VSQTTADPVHLPFWQVSPVVHALLSSHAVPLGVVGFAHGFGMVVVVVVGPSVDVVTGGRVVAGPSVDVVTGGRVVVAGAKVVVVAGGAQSRRLCLHFFNNLVLHRCSLPLRRPLHDAAIVSPHIALQKRIEAASAVKGPIRARNSPRSSCFETSANNKDRQPVFICSLPSWLAIVGTRGAVPMTRAGQSSSRTRVVKGKVGSGRFKQPDRTGFGHLTDRQRSKGDVRYRWCSATDCAVLRHASTRPRRTPHLARPEPVSNAPSGLYRPSALPPVCPGASPSPLPFRNDTGNDGLRVAQWPAQTPVGRRRFGPALSRMRQLSRAATNLKSYYEQVGA